VVLILQADGGRAKVNQKGSVKVQLVEGTTEGGGVVSGGGVPSTHVQGENVGQGDGAIDTDGNQVLGEFHTTIDVVGVVTSGEGEAKAVVFLSRSDHGRSFCTATSESGSSKSHAEDRREQGLQFHSVLLVCGLCISV